MLGTCTGLQGVRELALGGRFVILRWGLREEPGHLC